MIAGHPQKRAAIPKRSYVGQRDYGRTKRDRPPVTFVPSGLLLRRISQLQRLGVPRRREVMT